MWEFTYCEKKPSAFIGIPVKKTTGQKMPALPRNPSSMTKERLAEELKKNNIPLPRSRSRKEVYVELYRRFLLGKGDDSAGREQWGSYRSMSVNTSPMEQPKLRFSSDEEEEIVVAVRKTQVTNVNNNRSSPKRALRKANKSEFEDRLAEVEGLSDADLKKELQFRGVTPGPIVATTRAVYERKLADLLLQPEGEVYEAQGVYEAEEEDEADGPQEDSLEENGDSQEKEDDYSDSDVDESIPDTLLLTDSSKSQTTTSSHSAMTTSSSYKSQVTRLMDQEASSKARQRSVTPKRKMETKTTSTETTTTSKTRTASTQRKEKSKSLVPVWLQILIFLLVAGFLILVWYSMETGQSAQDLITDA